MVTSQAESVASPAVASPPVAAPAAAADTAACGEACLEFNVFARACPSRETLEHVTGRWGILALTALADGTMRFNALRRRVDGVSEKMLAQTLHGLERDGLVDRTARPTNPPYVEYSLTPLGRETTDRLHALIELVEGRMPDVLAARERYDASHSRD